MRRLLLFRIMLYVTAWMTASLSIVMPATVIPSDQRIPLRVFADRYGLVINTGTGNPAGIVLHSPRAHIRFGDESRQCRLNQILIWLHEPVLRSPGGWNISSVDALSVLYPLLQSGDVLRSAECTTFVLDPGHGGDDSGAIGSTGLLEKDVVLDIALRVAKKMRGGGIKILLTRRDDHYVELSDRVRLAEATHAHGLISIHLNAAANRKAAGVETHILPAAGHSSTAGTRDPGDPCQGNQYDGPSMVLAYCAHKALLGQTEAVDRGIRRSRFTVLRDAHCPSMLVECGFLSNEFEESRLRTNSHRDMLAQAIVAGIHEYARRVRLAH